MKIKLDENLPAGLVSVLSRLGHQADTVFDERLTGRADDVVWNAAQRGGRFLITQDLDFSDIRLFRPGTHHGLLLVRLRLPGRIALLRRIQSLFEQEDVENWRGCFVIVTDNKLRVRRPAK
jgi:predicted nuclease of predicted toxin-antitoxin system